MNSMKDLLVEQLQDLYDGEIQVLAALPRMHMQASDEELKEAIEVHIAETQNQVMRLERSFRMLEEEPTRKDCMGMRGILAETEEAMNEATYAPVKDMSIIAHALRIEHYEKAGYQIAIIIADRIDAEDVADLLEESYEEESLAAEALENFATESFFDKIKEAFSNEGGAHV